MNMKTTFKSILALCVILMSGVYANAQFKFGDKSTVGQTWVVDNETGACVLTTSFNPDKDPSSYTMDVDTAMISIAKCNTNKGLQITVRDTASNAVYNSDFRCRNYGSYENPVYVESVASLVDILNMYENNEAVGYTTGNVTSDTIPAHCIFKVGEGGTNGDGVFGAWPGQWKSVSYDFYYSFSGYAVSEDITLDLSTIYAGSDNLAGATATYYINLKVGSTTYDPVQIYTSGDAGKTIEIATTFGLDPAVFTNQKVYFSIYTEGTATDVATDTFDPVIGIDNMIAKVDAAMWMSPAGGATANAIIASETIDLVTGQQTDVTINIKDASRVSTLSIVNDNDSPKRLQVSFAETGAIMANDGADNYNVPVEYTYTATTADVKGSMVVAAPTSGIAEDDLMITLQIMPLVTGTGDYNTFRLELNNGTRIWYDITVNGTEATAVKEVSGDALKVYSANGLVFVKNASEDVVVRNLLGKVVAVASADEAQSGIAVSSGLYIVTSSTTSVKVYVK